MASLASTAVEYPAAIAAAFANVELPACVQAGVDEACRGIARFGAELGHEVAAFASVPSQSESAARFNIQRLRVTEVLAALDAFAERAGRRALGR